MSTIVPRWEWRTFGSHLSKARDVFDRLQPDRVGESDELYLLPTSGASVKIRDGLVDIKARHVVDANGLELWKPTMKQGFPLSPADVVEVFEAFQLPAEPAAGAESLDALLVALRERRADENGGGAQAARALRLRGLPGRGQRRGGGRASHRHDRHRIGRPRGGHPRDRARPGWSATSTPAIRPASLRSSTTCRSATP